MSDPVFSLVFDTVDIGLVVVDVDGCVVGWNAWMARITRRPAQQVIGKSLYEIFPDARDTRLPGVIEDSFQVGSSSILTHTLNALLPLQGEGGEPILHNIVVRPVSAEHANYCLLQITDVTVAVTRERVLRERQNARYHAIVDSAPDAIITIDNNRVFNGSTARWIMSWVTDTPSCSGRNSTSCCSRTIQLASPRWRKVRSIEKRCRDISRRSIQEWKIGHFDISLGTGALINAISSRQSGATLRNGWLPMPPCGMHATRCREVTTNWKAG